MKRYLIILVLLFIASIGEASAQKYPERRAVRSGNRHFEKGNFTEAEVEYTKANTIKPTYEGMFNHAGAVYKQERWDDALKEYNALLDDSTDVRRCQTLYNRGNTLFKKNSLQEAIESYKSALRLNPDDQEAKFNLAYAQKKLKDQQQQQNQNQQQQNQDQKDNKDNQNQDQQQDNNQQNNQDSENNKDQNDKQNQDQDQNDPNKNNESNNGNNQPNNDSNNQQQQTGQMPKEVAEQMLKAMEASEEKTREKVEGEKKRALVSGGIKNW